VGENGRNLVENVLSSLPDFRGFHALSFFLISPKAEGIIVGIPSRKICPITPADRRGRPELLHVLPIRVTLKQVSTKKAFLLPIALLLYWFIDIGRIA
jgi:hypothetical protein